MLKTRSWLLALGLISAAVTSCAMPPSSPQPAAGPAPEFSVTEQKAEDRVLLTPDGAGLVIDVWSESGIGSAAISLVSGEMPQPVVMRLHLAGLEQMRFGFEDTVVTLSVSSQTGEQVLRSATVDEQPVEVTPRGPYWMDVERVSAPDDPNSSYFQVTAPQAFYDSDAAMFLIAWIDFFR